MMFANSVPPWFLGDALSPTYLPKLTNVAHLDNAGEMGHSGMGGLIFRVAEANATI